MKKSFVCLLLIFFSFQVSLHSYSSNPKDFIRELVNDAITHLSDKNLTDNEKKELIEKIATENVDIEALDFIHLEN